MHQGGLVAYQVLQVNRSISGAASRLRHTLSGSASVSGTTSFHCHPRLPYIPPRISTLDKALQHPRLLDLMPHFKLIFYHTDRLPPLNASKPCCSVSPSITQPIHPLPPPLFRTSTASTTTNHATATTRPATKPRAMANRPLARPRRLPQPPRPKHRHNQRPVPAPAAPRRSSSSRAHRPPLLPHRLYRRHRPRAITNPPPGCLAAVLAPPRRAACLAAAVCCRHYMYM